MEPHYSLSGGSSLPAGSRNAPARRSSSTSASSSAGSASSASAVRHGVAPSSRLSKANTDGGAVRTIASASAAPSTSAADAQRAYHASSSSIDASFGGAPPSVATK